MNDRILKHESVSRDTGMRQDTRETWGRENHGFAYLYRKKSPKKSTRDAGGTATGRGILIRPGGAAEGCGRAAAPWSRSGALSWPARAHRQVSGPPRFVCTDSRHQPWLHTVEAGRRCGALAAAAAAAAREVAAGRGACRRGIRSTQPHPRERNSNTRSRLCCHTTDWPRSYSRAVCQYWAAESGPTRTTPLRTYH